MAALCRARIRHLRLTCLSVLRGGKQNAISDTLRGLRRLFESRKAGGDTYGAVVGIFSVGMRGSGWCEDDAGSFGQLNHALGAALAHLKTDEITTLGRGPAHAGNPG